MQELKDSKNSDNTTGKSENPYRLLTTIKSPAELKKLSPESLPVLCREMRDYLINSLSNNPGHFASSMGAIDIIVAMHYVFDTPRDRIIFDVGHQAYGHKLLTGRFKDFANQRKKHGISGFPFPFESEYDTFVCGHAGNSISAALGMAIADLNTPGEEDRKTVALIGDASISNGLAFEGLNNASQNPNNLLIILNDNNMSIDDNVGALHRYLSEMTTSKRYNRWRFNIYNRFKKWGLIQEKGKGRMLRFNNALKSLVSRQQNIFEGLNIRYFGPFNGNDVLKVVKVLQEIKDMQGPRLLHLYTRKGKGFSAAEENPAPWHAPGKFDPDTGFRQADVVKKKGAPLWQEVFGRTLVELADSHAEIVGITAAMPSGTSMNLMSKYPDRMFDVGISEGHAVTFAGGLAVAGRRPFVAIYSSFLQRAIDNIIHDVAIQHLPVTFCIDRAGLVGEDGVTHHGVFDLVYMSMIPGMKVSAPMDSETLRNIMYSSLEWEGPLSIRYPRGKTDDMEWKTAFKKIEPGKGRSLTIQDDADVAILSVGTIGNNVQKAVKELKENGIRVDHYDMIWIKPLDNELIDEIASKYKNIITIEDGCRTGGFGSAVVNRLKENSLDNKVINLGIPDNWVFQGTIGELQTDCGLDVQSIVNTVIGIAGKND